jgi:hypothetical protein
MTQSVIDEPSPDTSLPDIDFKCATNVIKISDISINVERIYGKQQLNYKMQDTLKQRIKNLKLEYDILFSMEEKNKSAQLLLEGERNLDDINMLQKQMEELNIEIKIEIDKIMILTDYNDKQSCAVKLENINEENASNIIMRTCKENIDSELTNSITCNLIKAKSKLNSNERRF